MAWGVLAMQTIKSIMLTLIRPSESLVLPTTKGLRNILQFGSLTTGAGIVSTLGGAAPDLVLGRTLGFAEVAYFSRGASLRNMFIDKIHETVGGVYFPIFAGQLRDGVDARGAYVHVMNYLLAVTAPLLVVLAILADPLIPFTFGDKWIRSTSIASTLCLLSLLAAPYALYSLALTACGRVAEYFRIELAIHSMNAFVFLMSVFLPLEQVVMLLAAPTIIQSVIVQRVLGKAFGLGFRELARGTWKCFAIIPFAVSGPLVTLAVIPATHGSRTQALVLVVGGVTAVLGWVLGLFALQHPLKEEIVRFFWKRGLSSA
jgi:O-antigen/teichoic acid export membrane protein